MSSAFSWMIYRSQQSLTGIIGLIVYLFVFCCCDSTTVIDNQLLGDSIYASNDICDYFFLDITTDSLVDSDSYGVSRYIDCDGASYLKIKSLHTNNKRLGIAFYDSEKRIVRTVSFKDKQINDNDEIRVEVPSGASFFRSTYYNTSCQSSKRMQFNYRLENYSAGRFRKYQSGNIFFSINVVQNFSYYSKEDTGTDIKATTSVLTLPAQYDPEGTPVPIIMYCHGYSHYVFYDTWGSTESFREQKKHWTDMGFAVFDTNGARNNNKRAQFYSAGSPQFVEAMRLSYEYILENYNVSDEVYIVGGSAGGPLALNYARFNKNVKGVALLSPWTDLYDCIWQQGLRSIFVEYYDFHGDDTYYDGIVNYYDPSKNMDELSVPIKIWVSSLERGGFIYNNSLSFYTGMKELNKDIEFEEVPGLQHSELVSGANEYVDTSVAAWFKSHNDCK